MIGIEEPKPMIAQNRHSLPHLDFAHSHEANSYAMCIAYWVAVVVRIADLEVVVFSFAVLVVVRSIERGCQRLRYQSPPWALGVGLRLAETAEVVGWVCEEE